MKSKTLSNKLAIFGGSKSITKPFSRYNSLGIEEKNAACEVIDKGQLSSFLGAWHDDFYGGVKVKQFEKACCEYFDVEHAVTVNSWTSGLTAAVGAIGIEPGDEVIVPTWTMCATATAVVHWNGIPIFADINKDTFNIDPISVEQNITPKTKAIIAVDIFGQSADISSLRLIAEKHQLKIISDSAQAPGAKVGNKYAGTMADIGGFSLNYHKHINTGEGGILVSNDSRLAENTRLIRNHAEAVVGGKGETNLVNMIGHNFRLGEIECAIGIEQLKKLDILVQRRQEQARYLSEKLADLNGLQVPKVMKGNTHAYYIFGMTLDTESLGVPRNRIIDALSAEGLDLIGQYQNIHLLPMFQNKIAYGTEGFPWSHKAARQDVNYDKGICPIAEELYDSSFIGLVMCLYELKQNELEAIVSTFQKVWENMNSLKI